MFSNINNTELIQSDSAVFIFFKSPSRLDMLRATNHLIDTLKTIARNSSSVEADLFACTNNKVYRIFCADGLSDEVKSYE